MSECEERMVVAEDDEAEVYLLLQAAKAAGVQKQVIVLRDGQQVIDYLRDLETKGGANIALPRVLVLDLKMPRRDGFEVLEFIRACPQLRPLPVVVLSNSSLTEDIQRAKDLGATEAHHKPLEFSGLIGLMKDLRKRYLA